MRFPRPIRCTTKAGISLPCVASLELQFLELSPGALPSIRLRSCHLGFVVHWQQNGHCCRWYPDGATASMVSSPVIGAKINLTVAFSNRDCVLSTRSGSFSRKTQQPPSRPKRFPRPDEQIGPNLSATGCCVPNWRLRINPRQSLPCRCSRRLVLPRKVGLARRPIRHGRAGVTLHPRRSRDRRSHSHFRGFWLSKQQA